MRHRKDFEKILENKQVQEAHVKNGIIYGDPYTGIIQDELQKKIALQNIKSHPLKFLQNCLSNIGRLIFNYPESYTLQRPSTLLRLPINGILIVFMIFCFIPTLINWRKILFPTRFLLFLTLLYLGGSTLGSASPRMFTPIVPILLLWIAFIIERSVKINLKLEGEKV